MFHRITTGQCQIKSPIDQCNVGISYCLYTLSPRLNHPSQSPLCLHPLFDQLEVSLWTPPPKQTKFSFPEILGPIIVSVRLSYPINFIRSKSRGWANWRWLAAHDARLLLDWTSEPHRRVCFGKRTLRLVTQPLLQGVDIQVPWWSASTAWQLMMGSHLSFLPYMD